MHRFLIVMLLFSVALAGCSGARGARNALPAYNSAIPYVLDTGDRIKVVVFGQESLSTTYPVDGAGNISMPLIGAVPARGITAPLLAQSIEQRLKVGYIRDPRVTAEVEVYRPFYILGEVTSAGQFSYVNNMTVQSAVAIAGGFSPRADQKTVEITRKMPDGSSVTGTAGLGTPVRPGDTIRVRERWF
jgi:polysaccharide biosynthesis/export protein